MPKQTGVNYGADLLLRSVGDNPSQRQGTLTGFNYDTVPRTRERPLVGAQDVRSYLEWLGQGGGLQNLNALGQGLFGPQGRQTVSDIAHNVQGPVQPLGLGMGGPNEMMGQAMDFLNPMGKVGGILGTLAGPTAKTANPVARNLAEQLKSQGRSDEDIWRLTAERHDQPWWLGHPDQVPRFEISDESMTYMPELLPQVTEYGRTYRKGPLKAAVSHPQLHSAYPDIGNINTVKYPFAGESGVQGEYRKTEKRDLLADIDDPPFVNAEDITVWGTSNPRSVVGHEIQHAIQEREGMTVGASGNAPVNYFDIPEELRGVYRKTIDQMEDAIRRGDEAAAKTFKKSAGRMIKGIRIDRYMRQGGEMDARAVQARQSLTQQERAARPFWMDYDRPLGQMIIRK